jgi:hypothetical protein
LIDEQDGQLIQRWSRWQAMVAPGRLDEDGLSHELGHVASTILHRWDYRRTAWTPILALLLLFRGRYGREGFLEVPLREVIDLARAWDTLGDRRRRYDNARRWWAACADQADWGFHVSWDHLDECFRPAEARAEERVRDHGYWRGFLATSARFRQTTPDADARQPPQTDAGWVTSILDRYGLSKTQLAGAIGCHPSLVSKWTRGPRTITPQYRAALREFELRLP